MTKIWFAAKRYGYGWYPATREGWMVIAAYTVLLLLPSLLMSALGIENASEEMLFVSVYVPYVLILTIILIWISAKKGEKARWRWGK